MAQDTENRLKWLQHMAGTVDKIELKAVPLLTPDGDPLDEDLFWIEFAAPSATDIAALRAAFERRRVVTETEIDTENPERSTTSEVQYIERDEMALLMKAVERGLIVDARLPNTDRDGSPVDQDGEPIVYRWSKDPKANWRFLNKAKPVLGYMVATQAAEALLEQAMEEVVVEGEALSAPSAEKSGMPTETADPEL